MERRDFLKNTTKTIAGAAFIPAVVSTVTSCDYTSNEIPTEKAKWQNWSGLQRCNPQEIVSPANEDELAEILKKSKKARIVGTGHSFMPLVPTDYTLVNIDQFSGLVSHNNEKMTATIKAGSKLSQISRDLDEIGQAIYSLPDIFYQSLAGSISTATHGTGKKYGALHHYIESLKLMTPKGELLECSTTKNSDLFRAAKVSLGALGVITEITLKNRKSYNLHRKVTVYKIEELLEKAPEYFEKYDHFELYYIPGTGASLAVSHELIDDDIKSKPRKTGDEDGLKDLKLARDLLSWSPYLRGKALEIFFSFGQVIDEAKDKSWRVLSQPRVTKFNESEFHVDSSQGIKCLKEVISKIDKIKDAYFPLEFRWIKGGDDAWLSPFQGHPESCSISIHADATERYKYLIDDFYPIFKKYEARPHWAKLNKLKTEDFAQLYPKFNDFNELRNQIDPQGKLLNDYLKGIFKA